MDEKEKVNEETVLDDIEEEMAVEDKEMVEADEEEEVEFGSFSDQIKYDVELLDADKDKVFVIEKAELKTPVMRDSTGAKIEPKSLSPNDPSRVGYTTKVVLTFKDTNYAAIVPSVKWYQQVVDLPNGKVKKIYNPWFNTNIKKEQLTDNQTSQISKLFYRYCEANGLDMKKVTQKQFYEGLVGQKVKLVTQTGNYKGKDWSKLEVKEFVK